MVKARKVGNSITVTIPKEIVTELDITEDTEMNLFVREGAVVMEPALSRWERLVAQVRQQATDRGLVEADVEQAVAEIRSDSRGKKPPEGTG
jgi:antitoxin component of MazEF toxin-antitoxin module